MKEIIQNIADYLNVPEVDRDQLFSSLITFSLSEEITSQYDLIRSYERKGMNRKEILNNLQNDGFDHLQAESVLHEYRSIRKVTNHHRGKRKFLRGVPVLFAAFVGFLSVYFLRNSCGIGVLGVICILSFVCIIIAGGATFGGLLQVITGWD